MDRFLGIICAVLALTCTILTVISFSWSWQWLLLLTWTAGLIFWTRKGLKKIDVGWKGQLLFLGGRMKAVMEEGWRWIPLPFGLRVVDCRETTMEINPLTVLTSDNIRVDVAGSVILQVQNISMYLDVDPSTIKRGIDDSWDEVIRTQVVGRPFDEVKKMHVEVSQEAQAKLEKVATELWGLRVVKVPVTIKTTDPKVSEDLELRARELLQRDGQQVELEFFAAQVQKLIGVGLTREQAVEQVQIALGQLKKETRVQGFTLDATTAEVAAKILGSLTGGTTRTRRKS